MEAGCDRRLLHICHTPGVQVEQLSIDWARLVMKLFPPVRVGGRLVRVGDGLKGGKEGKRMPAVKKLDQSSATNSKAPYIFGHSFQALGWLACGPLGQPLCVPLTSRIHEGVGFSNRARRTLLDQFAPLFLTVVAELEQGVRVVVAAYYASRKVLCPWS